MKVIVVIIKLNGSYHRYHSVAHFFPQTAQKGLFCAKFIHRLQTQIPMMIFCDEITRCIIPNSTFSSNKFTIQN